MTIKIKFARQHNLKISFHELHPKRFLPRKNVLHSIFSYMKKIRIYIYLITLYTKPTKWKPKQTNNKLFNKKKTFPLLLKTTIAKIWIFNFVYKKNYLKMGFKLNFQFVMLCKVYFLFLYTYIKICYVNKYFIICCLFFIFCLCLI